MVLFCDGASRGNPGPGAFGYVIWEDDQLVAEEGGRLGNVTNNVAEYEGLIRGLQKSLELGAKQITVKSDSELLVRQLNGLYRVRAPHLLPFFDKAKRTLGCFKTFSIVHVPREKNKDADRMANRALDGLV